MPRAGAPVVVLLWASLTAQDSRLACELVANAAARGAQVALVQVWARSALDASRRGAQPGAVPDCPLPDDGIQIDLQGAYARSLGFTDFRVLPVVVIHQAGQSPVAVHLPEAAAALAWRLGHTASR